MMDEYLARQIVEGLLEEMGVDTPEVDVHLLTTRVLQESYEYIEHILEHRSYG
jgi:hypothetical protein